MSEKPPRRSGQSDGAMKSTLEALLTKPLPAANTAEQVVLGSILRDPTVAEKVVDLISAEDFYADSHRLLYVEMVEAIVAGEVPELELVVERLAGKELLTKAGGIDYIASLMNAAPEPAHVAQYAQLVSQRSAQRQIITVAVSALQAAYQPGNRTPSDLISQTTQQMFDVADRSRAKGAGLHHIKKAVGEVIDQIEVAFAREDKNAPIGITTGFADLDHKTLGLQRGDFVVIAGRPAMGKTAFGINLAENASKATTDSICVFSMEMSAAQLALRMIATNARLDSTALRTGRIANDDWDAISAAMGPLSNEGADGIPERPIYVDDSPGLTPIEVQARCLRLRRQTGRPLGLVLIDYLQLMGGPRGNYGNDDVLRVSDISAAMKKMARELHVPVIALAQLNRGLENRVNKRPQMSDIRGSGSIEQDADSILFLYRDEVYNPETADKGICEVILGKNRNGPVGEVRLSWIADQLRFADLGPGAMNY